MVVLAARRPASQASLALARVLALWLVLSVSQFVTASGQCRNITTPLRFTVDCTAVTPPLDTQRASNFLAAMQLHLVEFDENVTVSLNLSGNAITSISTLSALLQPFSTIDLSNNRIANLTSMDFVDLFNLTTLDLSRNSITAIEVSTFNGSTHTPNVTSIDLSYNQLEALPEGAFANLLELTTLDLSYNIIRLISDSALADSSSLTRLVLSHNSLRTADFLGIYSPVRYLYLDDNRIETTAGMRAANFSFIDIRNNNITTLDLTFLASTSPAFNSSGLLCSGNYFSCVCLRNITDIIDRSNVTLLREEQRAGLCACSVPNRSYRYGRDCSMACDCQANTTVNCHPVSGRCNCIPDYALHNCSLDIHSECPSVCNCSEDATRLLYANCAGRNLTALPAYISPYTSALDLNNNMFTVLNGSEFATHTRLQTLSFRNNRISSIINGGLSQLPVLISLVLDGNLLTYDSLNSSGIFPRSLVQLDLSDNPIGTVPRTLLTNLTQLQELSMNNCSITAIEVGSFSGPVSPVTMLLSLRNNLIERLNGSTFQAAGSVVRNLYLNDNRISSIDSDAFLGLSNMWILSLNGNNLSDELSRKSVFLGLKNLATLQLSSCGITELRRGSFAGLNMTTSIDLDHNNLTSLKDGVFDNVLDGGFSFLTLNINLRHNQLQRLGDNVFANPRILAAQLSYNSLTSASLLSGCLARAQLGVIDLDHNRLTNLTADMFNNSRLGELRARSNRISSIPEERIFINRTENLFLYLDDNLLFLNTSYRFSWLGALTDLSLAGNEIYYLGRMLSGLQLRTLDVSRNSLGILPFVDLNYTSLVSLNASQNTMSTFLGNFYVAAPAMHTLDLSHNSFSSFSRLSTLGTFHRLTSLDLSYNQLANPTVDFSPVLGNMTVLSYLYLQGNRLKSLDRVLPDDVGISLINVSYNQLLYDSASFERIFTNASSFLKLTSTGNYFNSTCFDDAVNRLASNVVDLMDLGGPYRYLLRQDIGDCVCANNTWGLDCNRSCACNDELEPYAYRPNVNSTCPVQGGRCACSFYWTGRACEQYQVERYGCFQLNTSNTLELAAGSYAFGQTAHEDAFTIESCLANCSSLGYLLAAPFVSSKGSSACGCLSDFAHLGFSDERLCTSECGNTTCGGVNAVSIFAPFACENSNCVCMGDSVQCSNLPVFPPGIPTTTRLLDLSNNRIRSIPTGALSRLTNLASLNMSGNLLNSFDSSSRTIAYLNLANNRLEALSITSGSALKELYVQNNNVTNAYLMLPTAPALERLDISNNRLGSFNFPALIRGARSLNASGLSCNGNYFNCSCLKSLADDFNWKNDTNATNPDATTGCACSFNSQGLFTYGLECGMPCECQVNTTVRCTPIYGICQCIQDYALLNCSLNLRTECPQDCNCSAAGNHLIRTVCHNQGLTTLPPLISPFTSSLSLDGNAIVNLTVADFAHLQFLFDLSIQNNHISRIEEGAFDRTNLFILSLAGNRLTGPALNSSKLFPASLLQLDLGSNPLGSVPSRLFSNNSRLSKVNMKGCGISSIEDGSFSALGDYLRLILEDNNLTMLTPGTFGAAGSTLYNLALDNNHISSIDVNAFVNLTSLYTLSMSGNRIGGNLLPNTFRSLSNLISLTLTNCGITQLKQGTFTGLRSTYIINLNQNNLTRLDDGLFDDILMGSASVYVLSVDLSSNQISRLGKRVFASERIKKVYLSHNRLSSEELENSTFVLSHVNHIELENNALTFLSDFMFNGSHLSYLSARSNRINRLPTRETFLPPGRGTTTLYLDDNRISSPTSATFQAVR
eukprot:scpid11713/ scgid33336/ Leucine-rich repeats and immunoglobulin-like domains protein 3